MPYTQIIGYQGTVLPYMIQGELEAAIVMGLPTLGPILLTALRSQDIYLSGGALLVTAALVVLATCWLIFSWQFWIPAFAIRNDLRS